MRSVPEWIGATDDAAIPPRVRLRIWERDEGTCQGGCGRMLYPRDKWDLDHATALCNGGEHRERNLQVVCEWCHLDKTRADVKQKAKSYAVRAKHVGVKRTRKIRGWRRFNGDVVYAE